MKSFKFIAILLFVVACNASVNARTFKEKKRAESVMAFAGNMEKFDLEAIKAEIRELSISERIKLVKLSIADVKRAEAEAKAEAASSSAPGPAAASGKPTAGLYILAVLVPPIAVGIYSHWKITTLYNLLWTILGWLPGVVHAIIVLER